MSDAPDLTEFYKYSRPSKPPCKLGIVLSTGSKLKTAERTQLAAALKADGNVITAKAIITWLEKRNVGIDFHNTNITSHRQGRCTCAQS